MSKSPGESGCQNRRTQSEGMESVSLQKSSISNSSLRTESAVSLVNNESLGLDERGIFENFNKLGRHTFSTLGNRTTATNVC